VLRSLPGRQDLPGIPVEGKKSQRKRSPCLPAGQIVGEAGTPNLAGHGARPVMRWGNIAPLVTGC